MLDVADTHGGMRPHLQHVTGNPDDLDAWIRQLRVRMRHSSAAPKEFVRTSSANFVRVGILQRVFAPRPHRCRIAARRGPARSGAAGTSRAGAAGPAVAGTPAE